MRMLPSAPMHRTKGPAAPVGPRSAWINAPPLLGMAIAADRACGVGTPLYGTPGAARGAGADAGDAL